MAKSTVPALKAALLELMHEKKLDDITVDDLAARANVNKKTLYYHYDGISGLLCQMAEDWASSAIAGRNETPETWMEILRDVLEMVRKRAGFLKAIGSSRYAGEFRRWLNRFSDQYLEQFILSTLNIYKDLRQTELELTPKQIEYLVQYYSRGFLAVEIHWFETGMKESCEELVDLLYIFNRDNLYRTFDEILGLEPKILL